MYCIYYMTLIWGNMWFEACSSRDFSFFICYLAAPLPTLGLYIVDSLVNMTFSLQPESHWKSPHETGSLSRANGSVGSNGNLIWLQCVNSLSHQKKLLLPTMKFWNQKAYDHKKKLFKLKFLFILKVLI